MKPVWSSLLATAQQAKEARLELPCEVLQKLLAHRILALLSDVKVDGDVSVLDDLWRCLVPLSPSEVQAMLRAAGDADGEQEVRETKASSAAVDKSGSTTTPGQRAVYSLEDPQLHALPLGLGPRMQLCLDILVRDVLAMLVGMSDLGEHFLQLLTAKMTPFFENIVEHCEDSPATLDDLLLVSRIVRGVVDIGADPDLEAIALLGMSSTDADASTIQSLDVVLRGSQYYKEKLDDVMANLSTYKEGYPLLRKALAQLDQLTPVAMSWASCAELLELVPKLRAQVRPGACVALEIGLMDRISSAVTKHRSGEAAIVTVDGAMQTVKVAAHLWGGDSASLREASLWLDQHAKEKGLAANYELFQSKLAELGTPVDLEKLPGLEPLLANIQGLSLTGDQRKEVEVFLAGAHAAAVAGFPGTVERLGVLDKLASIVGGLQAMATEFDCLRAAASVHQEASAITTHGDSVEEWAASDPSCAQITKLIQSRAAVEALIEQLPAKTLPPGPLEAQARATSVVEKLGNHHISTKKQLLKTAIDTYGPCARGGESSDDEWHSSANADTTLEELIAIASSTILKSSPDEGKKAAADIGECAGRLRAHMELFEDFVSDPDAAALLRQGKDITTSLCLTNTEALLCALYAQEKQLNVKELKGKTHSIKKGLKDSTRSADVWTRVHPLLSDRAARAILLKP